MEGDQGEHRVSDIESYVYNGRSGTVCVTFLAGFPNQDATYTYAVAVFSLAFEFINGPSGFVVAGDSNSKRLSISKIQLKCGLLTFGVRPDNEYARRWNNTISAPYATCTRSQQVIASLCVNIDSLHSCCPSAAVFVSLRGRYVLPFT